MNREEALPIKLIRYLAAEASHMDEYRRGDSWHVDICNCYGCQDIRAWFALSRWERLLAKWWL